MILITGAAGKTGIAVLAALKARGARVRCFSSNAASAARLIARGADETVVGDLADSAALRTAMSGIRAVYHIART
jgi:NAD(P)H dehydrogenase (quinone)